MIPLLYHHPWSGQSGYHTQAGEIEKHKFSVHGQLTSQPVVLHFKTFAHDYVIYVL